MVLVRNIEQKKTFQFRNESRNVEMINRSTFKMNYLSKQWHASKCYYFIFKTVCILMLSEKFMTNSSPYTSMEYLPISYSRGWHFHLFSFAFYATGTIFLLLFINFFFTFI